MASETALTNIEQLPTLHLAPSTFRLERKKRVLRF